MVLRIVVFVTGLKPSMVLIPKITILSLSFSHSLATNNEISVDFFKGYLRCFSLPCCYCYSFFRNS